jgi:hypothetical protein
MKIVNILVAAALATGVLGATAVSADPHHGHKVCRTSWDHHHHRVSHCFWR